MARLDHIRQHKSFTKVHRGRETSKCVWRSNNGNSAQPRIAFGQDRLLSKCFETRVPGCEIEMLLLKAARKS